jgi:hypothetical protein
MPFVAWWRPKVCTLPFTHLGLQFTTRFKATTQTQGSTHAVYDQHRPIRMSDRLQWQTNPHQTQLHQHEDRVSPVCERTHHPNGIRSQWGAYSVQYFATDFAGIHSRRTNRSLAGSISLTGHKALRWRKRIVLTGNDQYIHVHTDMRFSLHHADNLFGTLEPRK